MEAYGIFEVDVTLREEITRRDVDGWVPGHAPGNGNYRDPQTETYRVVCRREGQARERALAYFTTADTKDVEILDVRKVKLDALIVDLA